MDTKTTSILLVEDDVMVSSLLKDLLSDKGFKVVHVDDGHKVFEILETQTINLILLDEKLPTICGTEVLINIKSKPKTSQIPIIMLTSVTSEDYQSEVLNFGADDYIPKPFKMNVLLARINAVLRRATSTTSIEIPEGADPSALNEKELNVLKCLTKGYNNHKISEELFISESTVANHIKNILSKLNVENRTHAAIIALSLNLIK